jgi:hypothetical protein
MPKKNIDYSKTIMYKIVSKDLDNDFIYVGSTTQFSTRKNAHKNKCLYVDDKAYNYKIYKTIRENGGWNNFQMIEIEKYPCKDKNESSARERYWTEFYHGNMNGNVPGRNRKMFVSDNKDKISKYQKQYREKNRDELNEYGRNRYHDNKEDRLKKVKEYREANAEAIKLKKSQKHDCECGGRYSHSAKSVHLRSNKHVKWLKSNSESDSDTSSDDDSDSD